MVGGIVALALVVSTLGVADPMLMKFLFDGLATRRSGVLLTAIVALLLLEVGQSCLSGWLSVLTWRVRIAIDFDVRERLLRKLYALPMDYHNENGVGGTMNKVNQSVTAFVGAFAEIAFNVLPSVVYLVLALAAMLRMEWRLALLVLAFTPVPALIGAWAAREQTRRERLLMSRWTRIYGRLNEVLAGIRVVKAFSMEEAEHRRFVAGQTAANGIVASGVKSDTLTTAIRGFVVALARITAIGFGGYLILHDQLTVGALVAFLGYVSGLFTPVQGLTNVYQTLRRAAVAVETIYEILDADETTADVPGATTLGPVAGDIRFDAVSFRYDDAPLFTNFDLRVRPGERLALVGPSGSGKSSLLSLLMRMEQPDSGAVFVDGTDIRRIKVASLRRQIAYVGQDIHLFNDTVRANISFGSPGATMDDVEVAARLANAHDFIMSLPQGYETVVGERGGRVSGGQRQRISIARAVLRNAPILLLAEATSAHDTLSVALVQEALDRLRSGRTTLMIAHRLSTVINADRIVVLRDGRILAEGTHAQLLDTCAYYAELVGASHGGFLKEQQLAQVA
jgi:ATP-binding cassette subfamily B protein